MSEVSVSDASETDVTGGGCLCGQLRYRVTLPPIEAAYCHCRTCRRSAGAPVMVWGTFRREALVVTGQRRAFASSEHARRSFCPDCGTQVLFETSRAPGLIDLNLATLDDPGMVPPEYHIWTASKIDWFDTGDPLPRHRDDGPDLG